MIFSIIIPTYNESEAIPHLLPKLLQLKGSLEKQGLAREVEIIVVDDGSTDGSAGLVRPFRDVRLIENCSNQGYGASIKCGITHSRGELLSFLDMDDTYQPQDIEKMLEVFQRHGNLDVVFGERMSQKSEMPVLRTIGNRMYALILKRLYRAQLNDVCTGLRVFRKGVGTEALSLREDGLNFSLSLTIQILKQKYRFIEVPIAYHLRRGDSKLSIVKDGLTFLWIALSKKWN